MEHIEIKSAPGNIIKTALGVLWIVSAIMLITIYLRELTSIHVIASALSLLTGVYFITSGFGLERSWFRTGENSITVKWFSMIRPVQIHDTRIEKIVLERKRIIIFQKAVKPLKLRMDFLEKEQRKELLEFLVNYSKTRNIELEKRFF